MESLLQSPCCIIEAHAMCWYSINGQDHISWDYSCSSSRTSWYRCYDHQVFTWRTGSACVKTDLQSNSSHRTTRAWLQHWDRAKPFKCHSHRTERAAPTDFIRTQWLVFWTSKASLYHITSMKNRTLVLSISSLQLRRQMLEMARKQSKPTSMKTIMGPEICDCHTCKLFNFSGSRNRVNGSSSVASIFRMAASEKPQRGQTQSWLIYESWSSRLSFLQTYRKLKEV